MFHAPKPKTQAT